MIISLFLQKISCMKIRVLLLTFLLLMLFSCTIEPDYTADVTNGKEYELYDYYVDEHGNEGIVIKIYNKKSLGQIWKYIMVMSLDEADLPWGEMGVALSEPDISYEYDGYALLMNQRAHYKGIEKYPAFEWCQRKNNSRRMPDINSWILPVQLDYNATYIYAINDYKTINKYILDYGGIPLDPYKAYWLADEDKDSAKPHKRKDYAYSFVISDWLSPYETEKNTSLGVRAIKYIYYENHRWKD